MHGIHDTFRQMAVTNRNMWSREIRGCDVIILLFGFFIQMYNRFQKVH